jgi:hypothetical protein
MHTYKAYIQSLQVVKGGDQHPDSTSENAMLPSLIALLLLANRLVREGDRGMEAPELVQQAVVGRARTMCIRHKRQTAKAPCVIFRP